MEKTSDVLTGPDLATDNPHLDSHSKRHHPQPAMSNFSATFHMPGVNLVMF